LNNVHVGVRMVGDLNTSYSRFNHEPTCMLPVRWQCLFAHGILSYS
jgi:hypothetical protein